MKRIVALLLALLLVVCLSATAFATSSNQGGTPEKDPKSPTTGSVAVIALVVVACGAGAAYAITSRKSK